MILPRQKTPDLSVNVIDGDRFDIDAVSSPRGVLICVYRGLHCPICATYLKTLDKLTPEFAQRDVETIAISGDGEERAAGMAAQLETRALRIGYDLPLSTARAWGLYLSTSRGKTSIGIEEPQLFPEPGVFLVRPDRSLYYSYIQTMPFVRPDFRELLKALDNVIEKNYPARGEYDEPV